MIAMCNFLCKDRIINPFGYVKGICSGLTKYLPLSAKQESMRKNYTKNNSVRLAAYSTMAAALTAVVADANAEVIYTDIEDMTVEVGDVFDVDVDGDGTFDCRFSAGYVSSSGGSI